MSHQKDIELSHFEYEGEKDGTEQSPNQCLLRWRMPVVFFHRGQNVQGRLYLSHRRSCTIVMVVLRDYSVRILKFWITVQN